MKTSICTLFENDYHLGLAGLANSLCRHGYRGVIWAGYRGELPPWAKPLKDCGGYHELSVADGCRLRFVPLKTALHFCLYKPAFMMDLLRAYPQEMDALAYFDPDIVVKCEWAFFEKWLSHGVALCEDVNSPVLASHPIRCEWKKYFEPHNFKFRNDLDLYANSGFVGVQAKDISFLEAWQAVIGVIEKMLGMPDSRQSAPRPFLFASQDQDALNVALMCTEQPVSLIGKEGMDIVYGGFTMSHALGSLKPWRRRYVLDLILKRKAAGLADTQYWKYADSPLHPYSGISLRLRKADLLLAKILSRLIK